MITLMRMILMINTSKLKLVIFVILIFDILLYSH